MTSTHKSLLIYAAIAALFIVSANILVAYRKNPRSAARGVLPQTEAPAAPQALAVTGGAQTEYQRSIQTRQDTDQIASKLRQTKAMAEELYRKYPQLKEQILKAHKVGAALQYADFFAIHGIKDDQRDLLLDLLADRLEAPNRGELGEVEDADIKALLGAEKYAAFQEYEKEQPGVEQADDLESYLRERHVAVDAATAQIRQIAVSTPASSLAISSRMVTGAPLSDGEIASLTIAARNEYLALRAAVTASAGNEGAEAIDAWINERVRRQIDIAQEVSAAVNRSKQSKQ